MEPIPPITLVAVVAFVRVPEKLPVIVPSTCTLPTTWSFVDGFVVPIPTEPPI